MRILVVNVNTTESMTEAIRRQAEQYASPGTEIIGLTPFFGPGSVESFYESYLATVGVIDRVLAYPEPFDAIIQAGFGEPGREGLEELFPVPVLDIAEAAIHTACLLGRRYSIIAPNGDGGGPTEDRLRSSGLYDRCVSTRPAGLAVLELEQDRERTLAAVVQAAKLAIEEDRAEVVCLGCGGMAGLGEEVAEAVGVPVVDGVAAAVQLAEALHRLGHKRKRAHQPRPSVSPKPVAGWPLHVHLGAPERRPTGS